MNAFFSNKCWLFDCFFKQLNSLPLAVGAFPVHPRHPRQGQETACGALGTSWNFELEEFLEEKSLVGGLEHFFHSVENSECHHPNWRTHIFQRGRSTTNQNMLSSKSRDVLFTSMISGHDSFGNATCCSRIWGCGRSTKIWPWWKKLGVATWDGMSLVIVLSLSLGNM